MLRPVFSFFNGCEGLGEVWADACPAARPDPREPCDKREHHAKPLLQRRHARTQRVPRSGSIMPSHYCNEDMHAPKGFREAGASCQATTATKTCTHPKGSAKRDLYAKPTASRETAQLWVYAAPRPLFREAGLTHPLCSKERQHGGTGCHATHPSAAAQGAHG